MEGGEEGERKHTRVREHREGLCESMSVRRPMRRVASCFGCLVLGLLLKSHVRLLPAAAECTHDDLYDVASYVCFCLSLSCRVAVVCAVRSTGQQLAGLARCWAALSLSCACDSRASGRCWRTGLATRQQDMSKVRKRGEGGDPRGELMRRVPHGLRSTHGCM